MGTSPPPSDAAYMAVYTHTDENGIYHGKVNPRWIKDHNITCVGQFVKQLLENPESNDWSGWIGIKNGTSEFGNPRVFYVGSQKVKTQEGQEYIGPGAITTVVDYNRDWVETDLIRAPFTGITYTDNFGKIDFLIDVPPKGDVQ